MCVTGYRLDLPILIPIHNSGKELVDVGARADEEEQAEQGRSKIKEGRLDRS